MVQAAPLIGTPVSVASGRQFDEFTKSGRVIATNISGATCLQSGTCFAASDETRFIQQFTLVDGIMQIGGRLYLAKTKNKIKSERKDFDIEALASVDDTLIAVGSHSWARKKCKPRPHNWNVFVSEVVTENIDSGTPFDTAPVSLQPAFERFPILNHFADTPLQQNGLNIEAVAIFNSTVYFGFRAPFVTGTENQALVLAIELDALRQADFSDAKLHAITLNGPPGLGIRGMETIEGGIMLLTGNAGVGGRDGKGKCREDSPHTGNPFALHFWRPGRSSTDYLGELALPNPKWKAEGLILTPNAEQSPNSLSITVFFDGPANGGPHQYTVQMDE